MLTAVKFYQELRSGSSLPLIISASDGNKYVAKLCGAGDGILANVVEWLASKLGTLLHLPVISPVFLAIPKTLDDASWDPEIRELLQKSIGVNLGLPYLENAETYSERAAHTVDENLKDEIFLYDLFLLNIDRNPANPNMIIHQGELRCLDYSSALMIRSALTRENYREHVLLRHLKRHPFYRSPIMPYPFINKLRQVADSDISQIVSELPDEWLKPLQIAAAASEAKEIIRARLIAKKNHGEVLLRMLDMLRIVKHETEEERHARSLQNRLAFEQKHGKI